MANQMVETVSWRSALGELEARNLMKRGPNPLEMRKEKMISSTPLLSSSSKGFKSTSFTNIPSWILTNLADLDKRMKMFAIGTIKGEEVGETFAERAESYYQKRPQLLTLLQDLYHGFLTLSDRYIQALAKQKHHSRHSSQVSTIDDGYSDQEETSGTSQIDSDIESSLSFQQLPLMVLPNHAMFDIDAIVSEFVFRNVEYDILMHEVSVMERKHFESSRKIELQKSLLEVLESERLVLLNENASLGYRINALVEENKGLASESMFIKRKAGELAKCVIKIREDHRVFLLHKKIEDLQAQIHGLEKRNKECYEQLLKRDEGDISTEKKSQTSDGVAFEVRLEIDKLGGTFKGKNESTVKICDGEKGPSLWKRVKNMDLFLCGMNPTCA